MPQITQGNRLYLYQLLSRELGVGKQTKIDQVELALVADDILPTDLDCADTRELMEALDDIVRVTIFKRGRVYVTVLANPEFDAYLRAPAEESAPPQRRTQSRRSWKQKRAPKIPKPAKPKPKNRPQESDVPTPATDADGITTAAPISAPEPEAADLTHAQESQPSQQARPDTGEGPVAARAESVSLSLADDTAPATPESHEIAIEEVVTQEDGSLERTEARPNSVPANAARTSESTPDALSSASDKANATTADTQESDPPSLAHENKPATGKSPDKAAQTTPEVTNLTFTPQDAPGRDLVGQREPESPEPQPISETSGDSLVEPEAAPTEKVDACGIPTQASGGHDMGVLATKVPEPTTQTTSHDEGDVSTDTDAARTAGAADEEPLFYAGAHTSIRLVSMPTEESESTPIRQRIFPDSFVHDVRMENAPLSALYSILPFDVDPMALLDEDWHFSESIESFTYEDARLRFPLRYLRSDNDPVEVTLRRVAPGASGKRWLLEDVAVGQDVGLWGLPLVDEGAWSHLSDAWRRPHTLVSPRRELARFAHLGQPRALLESLAAIAQEEWWGDDFSILSNYLAITFWRAMRQGKIAVSLDGGHAALDTGLVSPDGFPVLMHFTERSGKVPWTFDHFGTDDQGLAPEPPTYVSELSHITLVAGAGVRLSREVARSHGDAFTTHAERAVRYAVRNHRVATPAFDPQTDEIRLLVPIRNDKGEVFALVLAPDAVTGYIALSVMSREAAYACARAVSAEQPSWLRPR